MASKRAKTRSSKGRPFAPGEFCLCSLRSCLDYEVCCDFIQELKRAFTNLQPAQIGINPLAARLFEQRNSRPANQIDARARLLAGGAFERKPYRNSTAKAFPRRRRVEAVEYEAERIS